MEINCRILNQSPEANFRAARDITQDRETREVKPLTKEQWLQWFRSEHSPIRVISIAVWSSLSAPAGRTSMAMETH